MPVDFDENVQAAGWLLELCSCTLGVGSGALDLDPWVWALGPGISDVN